MFEFNWGQSLYNLLPGMGNPFLNNGTPLDVAFQYRQTFGISDMMTPDDAFVYNTYAPYLYGQPSLFSYNSYPGGYNPFNNNFYNYYSNNYNFYNNNSFMNQNMFSFNPFNSNNIQSVWNTNSFAKSRSVCGNNNQKEQSASVSNTSYDKNFKNSKKLGKDFLNKVKEVAKNVNCDYKDLLAMMNSESGIDPSKGLKKDGSCASAVGLIQFMDKGAIASLNKNYAMSLTRQRIVKMSALEQLDLVEKTIKISKKHAGYADGAKLDGATLYALIFLPARAKRDILCVKGEKNKDGKLLGYYEQNPMDYDKDNNISKKDLAHRLSLKRVDESIFA